MAGSRCSRTSLRRQKRPQKSSEPMVNTGPTHAFLLGVAMVMVSMPMASRGAPLIGRVERSFPGSDGGRVGAIVFFFANNEAEVRALAAADAEMPPEKFNLRSIARGLRKRGLDNFLLFNGGFSTGRTYEPLGLCVSG